MYTRGILKTDRFSILCFLKGEMKNSRKTQKQKTCRFLEFRMCTTNSGSIFSEAGRRKVFKGSKKYQKMLIVSTSNNNFWHGWHDRTADMPHVYCNRGQRRLILWTSMINLTGPDQITVLRTNVCMRLPIRGERLNTLCTSIVNQLFSTEVFLGKRIYVTAALLWENLATQFIHLFINDEGNEGPDSNDITNS